MATRRARKIHRRYLFFLHFKLKLALRLYGRNWKAVEKHVGSRTGAQIRSHAQKYFNRIDKSKGSEIKDEVGDEEKKEEASEQSKEQIVRTEEEKRGITNG